MIKFSCIIINELINSEEKKKLGEILENSHFITDSKPKFEIRMMNILL